MSWQKKVMNAVEVARGKAKEAAGRITGNARWTVEGRLKRRKGNLKQAGEKVKDAFGSKDRYDY